MTKRRDLSIPKRWSSPTSNLLVRALFGGHDLNSSNGRFFSSFFDKILNKKVGKITVFVCSITNFIPKCPVVATEWLVFSPLPSNDPTQNIYERIQPLSNDLKRYFFYLRGSPFPPPGPRRTFSEFRGHFGPWSWSNFQSPFDGRRYPEVAGVSEAALEGHKKTFGIQMCPVVLPFFGSRTIPY